MQANKANAYDIISILSSTNATEEFSNSESPLTVNSIILQNEKRHSLQFNSSVKSNENSQGSFDTTDFPESQVYTPFQAETFNETDTVSEERNLLMPRTIELLQRHCPVSFNEAKILDLGCGDGDWVKFFADQGFKNCSGVDISESMINKAKDLHPEFEFSVDNGLEPSLNILEGNFNIIFSNHVVQHFSTKYDVTTYFKTQKLALDQKNGMMICIFSGDYHLFTKEQREKFNLKVQPLKG